MESTDGASSGPEGPRRQAGDRLESSSRTNLTSVEEVAASMTVAQATRLLRGMARPYAALAIATLVDVCQTRRSSAAARVAAAAVLLDRAFGREVMIPAIPVIPARSGVMLIPSGEGRDTWEQKARKHHQAAIEGTSTRVPSKS